ncbi:unnamed protein product [Meganyctiphanes norvegica]|uniref:Carbohydrate sulfotransferase n=1 Tax=Meganyctiphanes norvegica TaxID=48144 RepID=A0AAV2S0I2_MEGNR
MLLRNNEKHVLIVLLFILLMCCIIVYDKSYSDQDSDGRELRSTTGNLSNDEWDKEQTHRRSAVRDVCSNLDRFYSLDTLSHNQWLIDHLLVDVKHKALYCYIPKVACTSWKRLWFYLTGYPNAEYASDPPLPRRIMHSIAGEIFKLSNKRLQPRQFKHIVQTYKKFLIVRHPFERLVSAYRDKFESNKFDGLARKIMLLYRNSSQVPEDGSGLSFLEFIQYVTEYFGMFSYTSPGADEHWRSYGDLCHPCAIQYDYIGKYESLAEDSSHILRSLQAPDHLHLNGSSTKTSLLVDTYMNQLSSRQRQKLEFLYQTDFKMFLYNH